MDQVHGVVPGAATVSQAGGAPKMTGYDQIKSVVCQWPLQAPGEWLTAAPAPILTGKSRPCGDILKEIESGAFAQSNIKMHETKDQYNILH